MSASRYARNITGALFTKEEVILVKGQLEQNCHFVLPDTLTTMYQKDLFSFEGRFYCLNGRVYYHVTNSQRKRLIKLIDIYLARA